MSNDQKNLEEQLVGWLEENECIENVETCAGNGFAVPDKDGDRFDVYYNRSLNWNDPSGWYIWMGVSQRSSEGVWYDHTTHDEKPTMFFMSKHNNTRMDKITGTIH